LASFALHDLESATTSKGYKATIRINVNDIKIAALPAKVAA
jgi:hypothetical protein